MKNRVEIKHILRHLLKTSEQVRKHFAVEAMESLSQSIEVYGIKFPIMVRPLDAGMFEVVAGERRLRATDMVMARVSDPESYGVLPCIVENLTNAEALEMQLIENLQREQVTAREEAEGYVRMLGLVDEAGNKVYPTVTSISERIGKSRMHVVDRLKLRYVHEALWEAYEEGKVQMAQLMLVGGVPHQRDRDEIGKRLIAGFAGRPLTYRETQEMVKGYRRTLKGAPFDPDDATLVPMEWRDDIRLEGGSCKDCPHRTGNDITLQGVDPHLCCNPRCFEKKVNIGWRAVKAAAENEGRTVVDMDGASRFFDDRGGVRVDSGFVDLADSPDSLSVGHFGGAEIDLWSALLENTVGAKESTVVRNPATMQVHYFLARERAIELAEENGHAETFSRRPVKSKKGKSKAVDDGKGESSGRSTAGFLDSPKSGKASKVKDQPIVNLAAERRWMVDEITQNFRFPALSTEALFAIVRLAVTLAGCENQVPILEYCGAIVDDRVRMKDDELWGVVETRLNQEMAAGGFSVLRFLAVILALGECTLHGGAVGYGAGRLMKLLKAIPEEASLVPAAVPVEEVKQDPAQVVAAIEAGRKPEELVAHRAYLATRSLQYAAEQAGVPLNTVRSWSRRIWKRLPVGKGGEEG